jgi:hypothetical protein
MSLLAAMAQVRHKNITTAQKYGGIPHVRSIKAKSVYTRAKKGELLHFRTVTITLPY